MFADRRSRRVVLVAHCILNQNAKIDGCARCAGAMRELVAELVDADLGIVQAPCPELMCLGLDRGADTSAERTVESEDTRVGRLMGEGEASARCEALARDVAWQAQEYVRHGFRIVGFIGINGSPTCGVERNWRDGAEREEPGVFARHVRERLLAAGLDVPMRGVRAGDPTHAASVARELGRR
jgi:predicted secreted protein